MKSEVLRLCVRWKKRSLASILDGADQHLEGRFPCVANGLTV
jgi:hypothetical protein